MFRITCHQLNRFLRSLSGFHAVPQSRHDQYIVAGPIFTRDSHFVVFPIVPVMCLPEVLSACFDLFHENIGATKLIQTGGSRRVIPGRTSLIPAWVHASGTLKYQVCFRGPCEPGNFERHPCHLNGSKTVDRDPSSRFHISRP